MMEPKMRDLRTETRRAMQDHAKRHGAKRTKMVLMSVFGLVEDEEGTDADDPPASGAGRASHERHKR